MPGFVDVAGAEGTSLTPAQLTQMSNAPTTLLQENAQLPANYSAEMSFGTAKDVGATRIGVIAAAGFSNTWRTRDAVQQVTDSPDAIYSLLVGENCTLVASTCGSSFDTVLSVHSDCPPTLENEILCNYDPCGAQSEVSVEAMAGTTYYLRVSGYDSTFGDFELDVRGCIAGPDPVAGCTDPVATNYDAEATVDDGS